MTTTYDPAIVRTIGAAFAADLAREVAKNAKPTNPWPLTTMPYSATPEPAGLSEADVRRIAEAVCDERERRAKSPLWVTPDDVRRWTGGRRG